MENTYDIIELFNITKEIYNLLETLTNKRTQYHIKATGTNMSPRN